MDAAGKVEKEESEIADNWEDFIDELTDEEEKKKNENKAESSNQSKNDDKEKKEKNTAKKGKNKKKNSKQKNEENNFSNKSDKYAEKLKAEKLVMNSDRMLADDLFEGCERPEGYEPATLDTDNFYTENKKSTAEKGDILEEANFNFLKGFEKFAKSFIICINKSNAKSCAWLRLLEIILRDTSPKLSVKELGSLANKISGFIQRIRAVTHKSVSNDEDEEHSDSIVSLNNLKQIEAFGEKLATKIRESTGKSAFLLRFFDLILPHIVPKMDAKDLASFFKNTEHLMQQKCISQKEAIESKRKPNDSVGRIKHFKDEIDLLYGDISEDDEYSEEIDDYFYSRVENDDDGKTIESDSEFVSSDEK